MSESYPATTTEAEQAERPGLRLVATAPPADAQQLDGAQVLDNVRDFVARFNTFPHEHCAPMLALWYAHTWAAEHFYITPRLVLSSAEPGSGKTRVMEVGQFFAKAAEMTAGGSAAALVRMVAAGPITILLDEVDTIFGAGGGGNEDVRQMLNLGYKRTATIPKCKGDAATGIMVERLPIFAPTVLAGLVGRMPPTITTRAITVRLRRRRSDEKVEPFRERRVAAEAAPICEALAAWVTSHGERLGTAEPEMPEGVADRAAEIWEPLLAIAEAAGGHWPETARAASVHFVTEAHDDPVSDGVRLLGDIRTLFSVAETERLHTSDILRHLHSIEEAPWGDFGGKALDARSLSRELSFFQVKPVTVKCNGTNAKGYVTYATDKQLGLADAWSRYLPPEKSTVDTEGL
ncbi:DUF3631 domain-containing protein [Crossiella sp. CA198]|uniref:DUF3631 domain-containing protein n=1 Tax=Crossiella sp. CA198 TaxID=3455607 RepID=UPI003F8D6C0B